MLEQDRINAMISYFFLGPLFLLAKKGTPLAETYVRSHSLKATKILGITLIFAIIYFIISPYIQVAPLGFDIPTLLLGLIMGGCSLALIHGAYRAYRGEVQNADTLDFTSQIDHLSDVSGVYAIETEEERSRILASLLPYVGIYLAEKYKNPHMIRGRIIGSFFTFLFAISLFFTSIEGFLPFVIMVLYIVIFVIEGVYLFVYGRFVSWKLFERIPSYREVEAHMIASLRSAKEFFSVVIGKEKKGNYDSYREEALESMTSSYEVPPYFMPVGLIGIPVWNIFSFPSFFLGHYKAYRYLIVQGFIITILFGVLFLLDGSKKEAAVLLLLFPILHILLLASGDIMTRSPGVGLWMHCLKSMRKPTDTPPDIEVTTEAVGFHYQVTTGDAGDTLK